MDDLTSKSAVRDGMMKYGFIAPDMTVHEFVEDELPSIPAVPLDELCEWLAKNADCPPEHSPIMDHCIENKCSECWKTVLKEWVEE